MKNLIYSILSLLILTSFFSCTKSAGTGGQATIRGKVIVDNMNILGDTLASYNAQDHDVFIIYGNNNNTHNDDAKTSYDGTFEFNFLNVGDYTLFTYSDCANCSNGEDSVVIISTTIEKRDEVIELEEIHIANFI